MRVASVAAYSVPWGTTKPAIAPLSNSRPAYDCGRPPMTTTGIMFVMRYHHLILR
ncbi:MAG: hypothetical protein H7836_01265 [Magnetococcus sp. YQC-3]